MEQRILLLPGSSPPSHNDFKEVYTTIERGARERYRNNLEYRIVCYPGHPGAEDGYFSYPTALEMSLGICREFCPTWIVGRSFGGGLLFGLLASSEVWVETVLGAVAWAPLSLFALRRLFNTPEKKQQEIEKMRTRGVNPSLNVFDTLPNFDTLVKQVAVNLRIARGTEDPLVNESDVESLAQVHREAQPNYRTETIAVDGVAHHVKDGTSQEILSQYWDCLFRSFDSGV